MTTVAHRSSLCNLTEALVQLGVTRTCNYPQTNNNNNNNNSSNPTTIDDSLNKQIPLDINNGGENRVAIKHVSFQVGPDDTSRDGEDDDNENNNKQIMHSGKSDSIIQNNKRLKKTIVIYITSGVKGGLAGKKALMAKFRHAVHIDPRSMGLNLPEWKDVPSPLDITCGVSDDFSEKHTRALMAQGVLMVKSSWMLHCITEKRLLVPINEDRFALRSDHPIWTKEKNARPPLVRVTESSYYGSVTSGATSMGGHTEGVDRGAKPIAWKKHHDDVIRVIHQAKIHGQNARANQFENLLKSSGKTVEEIHAREKHLFGWSADLLKL